MVTSPLGIRDKKKTLQSRFFRHVALYLSNSVFPTYNYGTTIKFLHNTAACDSISLLTSNSVLHTASPQIAAREANLPRPYRTLILSWEDKTNPSPSSALAVEWNPTPRSIFFSCPLHPTLMTERDLWKLSSWRRSSILASLSLILLPISLAPLEPPPNGQENWGQSSSWEIFHLVPRDVLKENESILMENICFNFMNR